jgi:hypothetical protein
LQNVPKFSITEKEKRRGAVRHGKSQQGAACEHGSAETQVEGEPHLGHTRPVWYAKVER